MNKQEIETFTKNCSKLLGYETIIKYDSQKLIIDDWLVKAKFDSDWNWIMQVIEKIELIHDDFHGYFGVHITSNCCTIQGTNLKTSPENFHPAYFYNIVSANKLYAVTECINKFLIWYYKTHQ